MLRTHPKQRATRVFETESKGLCPSLWGSAELQDGSCVEVLPYPQAGTGHAAQEPHQSPLSIAGAGFH